eukprot:950686-Ditylum_brightwellii.AAC.1
MSQITKGSTLHQKASWAKGRDYGTLTRKSWGENLMESRKSSSSQIQKLPKSIPNLKHWPEKQPPD